MTDFSVQPSPYLVGLFDEEKVKHVSTTVGRVIDLVFHNRELAVELVVKDQKTDRPLYTSRLFERVQAGQKVNFEHILAQFNFSDEPAGRNPAE